MKYQVNPSINLSEGMIARAMAHQSSVNLDVYSEALKLLNFQVYDKEIDTNMSVLEAYSRIYSSVTSERIKVIQDVDKARSNYLLDVALEQMSEDALAPEIGSGQIVSIKYPKDAKIEKILSKLERDLNIDQFLINICPDLLAYGEYIVATDIDQGKSEEYKDELSDTVKNRKVEPRGLVAIRDIIEQGTVISLTQDGEPMGYLGSDEQGRIVRFENADFIKFTLGGQRIRVKLEDTIPYAKNEKVKKFLETLPRFVRVGKSAVHRLIPKFKELELLEKLVPASKLSKLSNVNLVGMNVPGQFDLEKGLMASKRVENLINNKVGVDQKLGEITVESILSVAGRTKVVPLFGDKGSLQKLDYKQDEADDMTSSVEELRRIILDSIGVPYELIYKSEGDSKSEILKRYARYLRRLKNIQRSLAEGVKQICCIHLANLGETFNEDDIVIEFLNKLVEIDNLDKLEHADVTVSLLGNVADFFGKLMEADSPYRDIINVDEVAEYINRNLRTIGLDSAMRVKSEKGQSVQLDKDNVTITPPAKTVDMNYNKGNQSFDTQSGGQGDTEI